MIRPVPTVGVVVPTFNAAATIEATLASVCNQTYRALDVVVVDDGSTDGSATLILRWASRDPRFRLCRTENGGVAAARNCGVARTNAPFLAFVDADDVWAPNKIELQMKALEKNQGVPALVYCWFAQIDANGRTYPACDHPVFEGDVFRHMCRANFVGNCSSMLMAREVFERVGGFDPSLRARKAQGCEDLMFLLRAAEQFPFYVVPRHLVGYRLTPNNMSGDTAQMLRSFRIVADTFHARRPEYADEFEANHDDVVFWLAERAVIAGRLKEARRLLGLLPLSDPRRGLTGIARLAPTFVKARLVPRWFKKASQATLGLPPRPPYKEVTW
jgi:glycosyltransferase involved in cell wall biosynthesis